MHDGTLAGGTRRFIFGGADATRETAPLAVPQIFTDSIKHQTAN